MTIRVGAITRGVNDPASRFRVRQHVEPLQAFDIHISDLAAGPLPRISFPHALTARFGPVARVQNGLRLAHRAVACLPQVVATRNADVTWLVRGIVQRQYTLELLLKRPYVLDIDDAIWLLDAHRYVTPLLAGRAEVVLAGNEYLAEHYASFCRNVQVVPTAVDTDRFRGSHGPSRREPFVVGWIGTSWSFDYLYAIEDALRRFLASRADASLLIVSDRAPRFSKLPADRVCFRRWSAENDVMDIQSMDVGIMPLPDNEWARGKCSLKMLQYMACELPVIVSPVGMNADILEKGQIGIGASSIGEWEAALDFVYSHRERVSTWGQQGRIVVEREYSRAVITPKLASIFSRLAAGQLKGRP